MESFSMIATIVLAELFIPLLAMQERNGHRDFGLYAHMQIPVVIGVVLCAGLWIRGRKMNAVRSATILMFAYVAATASSNLLGEILFPAGSSGDLPIRQWLAEHVPPAPAPDREQIFRELGAPLDSAVLKPSHLNVPDEVMTDVRYAPEGSEVLVYGETGRDGRRFTYFIFIDPVTGKKAFHREVAGDPGDELWPGSPLR